MSASSRIDLRVDADLKKLAERAAAIAGNKNLSDFVTQAIREKAIALLEQQSSIELSNDDFDRFINACKKASKPNKKLFDAAKRFDAEGFK